MLDLPASADLRYHHEAITDNEWEPVTKKHKMSAVDEVAFDTGDKEDGKED